MKRLLLLISSFALTLTAYAESSKEQDQLVFAHVFSNVRYFYPAKNISKQPWHKFLLTNLTKVPSTSSMPVFAMDVESMYQSAGIHIKLHAGDMPVSTLPAGKIKGRHWHYEGNGEDAPELLVGRFIGFFYERFGPYGKKLARVNDKYLEQASKLQGITYNQDYLYSEVYPKLWLGIPWKPGKISRDVFEEAMDEQADTTDMSLRSNAHAVQLWSVLYHFFPYPVSFNWDTLFLQAQTNIKAGKPRLDVLAAMTAQLNDGHAARYEPGPDMGIVSEYIDGKLWVSAYGKDVYDTSLVGWQVLTVNGRNALDIYRERYALTGLPGEKTREVLAAYNVTAGTLDSSSHIVLQHPVSGDTLGLTLKHFYRDTLFPMPPDPTVLLKGTKGIAYCDLSKTSSKKIVKTLKNDTTKAIILDLRNYPRSGWRFLRALTDKKTEDLIYLVPVIDFPGKHEEKFDTLKYDTKPLKEPVTGKVVVFLQSEWSGSQPENLLDMAKVYKMGTIIGRHTVGTTGNITFVKIPKHNGEPSVLTFTGMRTLNRDYTVFSGVVPDIEVPRTLDELRRNGDDIMEVAIKYIHQQLQQQEKK